MHGEERDFVIVFHLGDRLVERNVQTVEGFRFVQVQQRSVRVEEVRRRRGVVVRRRIVVSDHLNGDVRHSTRIEFVVRSRRARKRLMSVRTEFRPEEKRRSRRKFLLRLRSLVDRVVRRRETNGGRMLLSRLGNQRLQRIFRPLNVVAAFVQRLTSMAIVEHRDVFQHHVHQLDFSRVDQTADADA